MKVAFLISAYTDPHQLGRLVHTINDGENHFFIHVDKKVDVNLFISAIDDCDAPFCTFIEERYWVQWGGFNQVMYQRALLRACVLSGTPFEKVFIISAQDYPLIPITAIKSELEKSPDREYLMGLNLSDPALPAEKRDRICLYHFGRDIKVRSYKLKMICSGGLRILMRLLPFRKKPYIEVGDRKWSVYMSSSYLCITSGLAKFILNEMENNKAVMDYFRYSFVPEEMVIPTIVYNSEYAPRTLGEMHQYKGLVSLSAITQFWYGRQIKILDENDYNQLVRCHKMFARKFQTGQSETLMERLSMRTENEAF